MTTDPATDPAADPATDPRVRGIDTTDAELAHEILRRTYRVTQMTSGGTEPFRFTRHIVGEERFALSRIRYSSEWAAVSEPLPFFCVSRLDAGELTVTHDTTAVEAPIGGAVVFPTDRDVTTAMTGIDVSEMMLDRSAVEREMVSLGIPVPSNGLHFTSMTSRTPDVGRLWDSVSRHVHRDVLGNDAAMSSELVRGAAFRLLVSSLLESFEHNAERSEASLDTQPLPATVRRALAFIEEHAHDDIGLGEIAEAARLTPRGLQFAFRRHLDTTPMAALRRARLRGAHDDLVMADPSLGHTVAGIALSWGFVHPGRFTAAYVEEFGRSPRSTLES